MYVGSLIIGLYNPPVCFPQASLFVFSFEEFVRFGILTGM